jgi:hypothetical protein
LSAPTVFSARSFRFSLTFAVKMISYIAPVFRVTYSCIKLCLSVLVFCPPVGALALTVTQSSSFSPAPAVIEAGSAGLPVRTLAFIELESGESPFTASFRVRVELRDEFGVLVPLVTGSDLSPVQSGTVDPGLELDLAANLRPTKRLQPDLRYQASSVVEVLDSGVWQRLADPALTAVAFVPHFINTANDAALNVVATVQPPAPAELTRTWLLTASAGAAGIPLTLPVTLARYDDFVGTAPSSANVSYRVTLELRDNGGQLVPLASGGQITGTQSLASHLVPGVGQTAPAFSHFGVSTTLVPAAQLDSVNGVYTLRARVEHIDLPPSGPWIDSGQRLAADHRFLHFSGALTLGNGSTATFNALANQPARGAIIGNGVSTNLELSGAAGLLAGPPALQFGGGPAWGVRLLADGTAVVSPGGSAQPAALVSGSALSLTRQGFSYTYGPLTVDAQGVRADGVTVGLPQGLGYLPSGGLLAESTLFFSGDIALSADYTPPALNTLLPAGARMVDEALPITYPVAAATVEPAVGALLAERADAPPEWIHTPAYAFLAAQAATYQTPELATRHGNDAYLSALDGGDPTITFTVAPDLSARSSLGLTLAPAAFTAHFPDAVPVAWSSAVNISLNDSRFAPGSSLSATADLTLTYRADCAPGTDPASACAVGAAALRQVGIQAVGESYTLTPQGGLHLTGPTLAAAPGLAWGLRATATTPVATHEVDPLDTAAFHLPGASLLAEDNPLLALNAYATRAGVLAPAALLLSGYDPATAASVLPETPAYALGTGDYAGFNLTAPANHPARSRLADNLTPSAYVLAGGGAAKYYVRPSGVSGRHVPLDTSLPPTFTLYGYTFAFDRFQFSYLSGRNLDSWTDGSLVLSHPADFTQRFASLTLTCSGQLLAAELDPTDLGPKTLAYWQGSLTPRSLLFAPVGSPSACPPPPRRLVIAASTEVAQVAAPLHGLLGFKPDGDFIRAGDGVAGINSELRLPASVPLAGPGAERYILTPTSTLRFNNPASPGAPAVGFVTFGATIRMPFFRTLPVQAVAAADPASPNFYLAKGWSEGEPGRSLFNAADFDPEHRGWPGPGAIPAPGLTYLEYINPSATTDPDYLLRAEQSLLGLVDLSYPLLWNNTGRYFRSIPAPAEDLLVLEVEHHLDYLSARRADLNFGLRYDGLPQLRLSNLLIDAADERIGASRAFANAGLDTVRDALGDGLDSGARLVSDQTEALFNPVFDAAAESVLRPFHQAVLAAYAQVRASGGTLADFKAEYELQRATFLSTLDDTDSLLSAQLNQLGAATGQAASLATRVDRELERLILALDAVSGQVRLVNGVPSLADPAPGAVTTASGLLRTNAQGDRTIALGLVQKLLVDMVPSALAPALDAAILEAQGALNTELRSLLAQADPTLDRVEQILAELRARLVTLRGTTTQASALTQAIAQTVADAEASGNLRTIAAEVARRADALVYPVFDQLQVADATLLDSFPNLLVDRTEDEFVALLRAELRDRLLADAVAEQLRHELRQRLYDLDYTIRGTIDTVFAELSALMKRAVGASLGALEAEINPLLGEVSDYVGSGEIRGYAQFDGDSVRRLRLDGKFEFKVPEEMGLAAYLEIFVFRSGENFPASACLTPGQVALEATIGAKGVPLDWISPDLNADLAVKLSFTKDSADAAYFPTGIAGSFVANGELDFESFLITELKGGVAIGTRDSYLALATQMKFSDYAVGGAIFFGTTCDIAPLRMVDKDVADLIGQPPFSGAYVYGEVWLPISETLLGIPSTCMFNISAGIGAGAFYFVEGPTYGGRILAGVSGEALCLVTVKGTVNMIGVVQDGSLRFRGTGKISGQAGACPLCVKFSEQATMTYQSGSWSVSF